MAEGVHRALAFGGAILFAISWAFPLGAGLAKDTSILPRWWGPVDVTLAFAVAILAFAIQALVRARVDKRAEEKAYRIYRTLMHAIMVTALLVMAAGDRIVWANCATGFLWRSWLFVYILPWWFAAASSRKIGTEAPNLGS